MQTGTEDEGEREGRRRSIAGESKEQTQTVVGRGETGVEIKWWGGGRS